jgi:epoxide hydrolase-like predicted phosphatase
MIKAVIFDVGGVLLRTQSWEKRLAWDARLGLAPGTVEQMVFNSEHGRAAQCGQVTAEAHWQWVGEQLGLSAETLTQFRTDFWAGDKMDTDLIAYIRRLRPAYITAIISNYMDSLRDELTHDFQVADAFDLIVVSAEFGTMKPDPRIYQYTLDQLDVVPDQSVFIDDFAHNIAAARNIGMHAIHYTSEIDLYAELAQLGVA